MMYKIGHQQADRSPDPGGPIRPGPVVNLEFGRGASFLTGAAFLDFTVLV